MSNRMRYGKKFGGSACSSKSNGFDMSETAQHRAPEILFANYRKFCIKVKAKGIEPYSFKDWLLLKAGRLSKPGKPRRQYQGQSRKKVSLATSPVMQKPMEKAND